MENGNFIPRLFAVQSPGLFLAVSNPGFEQSIPRFFEVWFYSPASSGNTPRLHDVEAGEWILKAGEWCGESRGIDPMKPGNEIHEAGESTSYFRMRYRSRGKPRRPRPPDGLQAATPPKSKKDGKNVYQRMNMCILQGCTAVATKPHPTVNGMLISSSNYL